MLRLRRDMECRAARRAFAGPPDPGLIPDLRAQLDAMEAGAREGDAYRLAEADRAFHRRLFAAARLPSLEPLLLRCLTHNHRYKMLQGPVPPDLSHTARRHLGILAAVERRDAAALAAELAHHVATILDGGPSLLDEAEAP